jgi:hypothetical protein
MSAHAASQSRPRSSPPSQPLAIWTWWFALALLVLFFNDSFLKSAFAGTWHSVWTGKLSTAAGAVILPAWIQVVLVTFNVDRRSAAKWAVAIALVFLAGLELSPELASVTSTLNQALLTVAKQAPGKVSMTADLTDLLTLPFCWTLLVYERRAQTFT